MSAYSITKPRDSGPPQRAGHDTPRVAWNAGGPCKICAIFGTMEIDRPLQEAAGVLLRIRTRQPAAREWVPGLSLEDRKIVGRDIQKVEFGWPLGMPYCRSLGNDLWEVRSGRTDVKITRVIFCVARERMGAAARLYQQNAEYAGPGLGTRAQPYEGGALR